MACDGEEQDRLGCRAVLLTDSLPEYALAASVHRQLAAEQGLVACYPVLTTTHEAPELTGFLKHYGIVPMRFSSVCGVGTLEERSEALWETLFRGTGVPVEVSVSDDSTTLTQALFISLTTARPLVFRRSDQPLGLNWGQTTRTGRLGHWVLARSGSPLSVMACFYAAATEKQFGLIDESAAFDDELRRREFTTAILVDDYRVFNKQFLAQLSRLSLSLAQESLPPSLLTAYSASDFSALMFRLLAHRDFRMSGCRLSEPVAGKAIAFRGMEPLEFYILTGHGNELHIEHGRDEVIYGALSRQRTNTAMSYFNSEPSCPVGGRVPSSSIRLLNIVLLSCDSCTFGDGFAPPESSVLLDFLNGWCTSVIAPFKHAMISSWLTLLADALIRSGYCLGEITQRLNSVARLDSFPDGAFVLVGDPEFVPSSDRRWRPPQVRLEAHTQGIDVECTANGARTLDVSIPIRHVAHLMSDDRPLAVVPLSPELSATDVYFAFRPAAGNGALGVIVFTSRELPAVPLRFRLKRASEPGAQQLAKLHQCLARVNRFSVFGLEPETLHHWTQEASRQLTAIAAYPRVPELMGAHALLERYTEVCDNVLTEIRVAVLHQVLDLMAREPLWLSHVYSTFYPKVRQLAEETLTRNCLLCGNQTSFWLYEGNSVELSPPPRGVRVCVRCGITSDAPFRSELEVRFPSECVIAETEFSRDVTIQNLSARSQAVTLLLQFNEWKARKICAEPVIQTVTLNPGETRVCGVRFSFRRALRDDLLSLNAFALSGDFDLSCFTQRMLLLKRSEFRGRRRTGLVHSPAWIRQADGGATPA